MKVPINKNVNRYKLKKVKHKTIAFIKIVDSYLILIN